MRKRFGCNKCSCALSFAGGLIASCFLPPKFLVAVLAVWVIVLALSGGKRL